MKFPLLLSAFALFALGANAEPIEFNRDIRPILSENCFFCHGQDPKHREAELRLDEAEGATRDLGGYSAVVPGFPEKSAILERLESHDKEAVMPPRKANRHVSPEQVALLRRWIAEGAAYQRHWAYVPPRKVELPERAGAQQNLQPIDRLVRARLQKEGLTASTEAPPETWLRRATLDLTGLPPTLAELDAFAAAVAAQGDEAYAQAADRLLASPHFGERLALDWLDAARYADSHGFNNDGQRSMWRWRDWVIEAFNRNLPYDQFITEQLAGDLLPQPTLESRIATGFSRNHVINSEGGIIDEEYRVEYVADRVRTMSTAWLGLTFECAKCHDHKFDPLTQKEYYQLFAFFNNVPEHGEDGRTDNAVPMIPAPTREQQALLAGQEQKLAQLRQQFTENSPCVEGEQTALQECLRKAIATREKIGGTLAIPAAREGGTLVERAWQASGGDILKVPGAKLDWMAAPGASLSFWIRPEAGNAADVPLLSAIDYRGSSADAAYGRGREVRLIGGEIEVRISDRFPIYALVVRTVGAAIQPGQWRQVALSGTGGAKAEGLRLFLDGAEMPVQVRYDGLSNVPGVSDFTLGADNLPGGARFQGALAEVQRFPRPLSGEEVEAVFRAEALPLALAGQDPRGWLPAALQQSRTPQLFQQYRALWEEHLALRRTLPTTMVMEELPEGRPTFVLSRGRYDAPTERVDPGVPEKLLAPWPSRAPKNRLGLAQWLTQPEHPLTARVVVNRFWAQLFGVGLVKSLEDFGSQSEWPSHPEVLDWLARDFIESRWDVKALFKKLVLSATYRQSSATTPELTARDPENRLLARGPRFRLPAEVIRDQALAVSGLLTRKFGGPSVFPYQPEKLYDGVVVGANYPGSRWKQSLGEDLYRRSLYTYWKRTVTHPAMLTFDAPDREFCSVRRARTNTPLQALVLWNEPGYLESARALATHLLREAGGTDADRLAVGFREVTGRRPRSEETSVLLKALVHLREDYLQHPPEAEALLQVGAARPNGALAAPELAAYTAIASMLLNLDETITKN